MREAETPYTETEFLIRVLNDDEIGARKLMVDMSDRELEELRKSFRKGKWWVEEEQSVRYSNARSNQDAKHAGLANGSSDGQQERPAASGT